MLYVFWIFFLYLVRLSSWEIKCPHGCGDPDSDAGAAVIGNIFSYCIDKADFNSFDNYREENENTYQVEWVYSEENALGGSWYVYDIERLVHQDHLAQPEKITDSESYFLRTYPQFLKAYSVFYKDFLWCHDCIISNLSSTLERMGQEKNRIISVLHEFEEDLKQVPAGSSLRADYLEAIEDWKKSLAYKEKQIKSCNNELSSFHEPIPAKLTKS